MKNVILFLFLGSIYLTVFGQLPFEPIFEHLPAEKFGVNQIVNRCLDAKGQLWIATDKGIVCYDDYASKTWSSKKGDNKTMLSNHIQAAFFEATGPY